MSVFFLSPYTPLLYSKTGVYRGRHYYAAVLKGNKTPVHLDTYFNMIISNKISLN